MATNDSPRKKFIIPKLDEKTGNDPALQAQSLFNRHKKGERVEEVEAPKKFVAESLGESSGSVARNSEASPSNVYSSSLPTMSGATSHQKSAPGSTKLLVQQSTGSDSVPTEINLTKPKSNSLIVSPRQKGNPILKHVRNVPFEFGDIIADYEMGTTNCALFLSLRYHHLNPSYVHERLKQLGRSYDLRVLLVQVDVKDPAHSLRELAKICLLSDCTMILAWTPEEAGRYLETYKSYENKPPDLIMEKTEGNYLAKATETLTSVKKVNKTDSMTLLSTFGTMQNIIKASEEDLSLCPGFGPQKAKRLHDVLHEPFLKSKKKGAQTTDT